MKLDTRIDNIPLSVLLLEKGYTYDNKDKIGNKLMIYKEGMKLGYYSADQAHLKFIVNDPLTIARDKYHNNKISFLELDAIFFKFASSQEKEKFWNTPVFDRPNIIIGKSQCEIDKEWRLMTSDD
jgi:hypothetical protein